jgi:hypothetical protein
VPVLFSYSPYDDCFGHCDNYVQLPAPPILPSSSFSELAHALVEVPLPEPQPILYGSIALPSLSMPSPFVPKHELFETLAGLNAVAAVNGQPFSPISLPSTLPLSPRPKEESQDQVDVFTPAGLGVPHVQLYTSPPVSKVCSPPHSLVTYTHLAG